MDDRIKENLAIEIANKSIRVATLEAKTLELEYQLNQFHRVLNSDEALRELFNEKMEELDGIRSQI